MTDGLDGLRARFRQRVADEAFLVRRWSETGRPDDPAIERVVHNLAGAAGTLGYAKLHTVAAAVDDHFAEGTLASPEAAEALLAEIDALIAFDR